METLSEVQEPEVYEILKKAVQDGLDHICELESQNTYIGTYFELPEFFEFPHLNNLKSFFPRISVTSKFLDGPTDYTRAFDKDYPHNTSSWQTFIQAMPNIPSLKKYYRWDDENTEISNIESIQISHSIKSIIDRYIHINGRTDFDENDFCSIYLEWERAVVSGKLQFDMLVPLLCITFDFDVLELNDGIAIERIPDEIQLARVYADHYRRPRHDAITSAATHALLLRYWALPNGYKDQKYITFDNIENFSPVLNKVDLFLAAFRTVTGIETGYNQIVGIPYKWTDSWTAHLPKVYAKSVRAYPDHFDNRGWLNEPPVLSEQQCRDIFNLFTVVSESESNKLTLACKRLNMAHLRRTEEDAILDITIALEALLADDGHGEITYRLAMRLGALGRIEPFEKHTPTEVVEMCKRIYAYRSSVVHGSHNVDKKRIIPVKSSPEPIPAVTLGLSLLRYAIKVLSQNPDLLQTKNLDEFLLCGPETSEAH